MNEELAEIRRSVRHASVRLIRAECVIQSVSGIEVWHVEASPALGRWRVRSHGSDFDLSFDGVGTLRDHSRLGGGAQVVGRGFRAHPAVQLLFPDGLSVWGGDDADWSPVGLEPGSDGRTVVALRHRSDRSLFASITHDSDRNLFVRLDSPTYVVHLRAIAIE